MAWTRILSPWIWPYDHEIHRKMKLLGATVKLSETPANPYGLAPEHCEHTEQVLTEILGYSWEDVDKLRQSGAI
jgi:crotonobetainyl-CoA:carnitine CoA-transferase CaiB-like acyl-CoA transferase